MSEERKMGPAEIAYRAAGHDDEWNRWSDYGPIIDSLGKCVVYESDGAYQGDSYIMFRDGARFGVLVFGWGSCSGCDSLEACSTWEDVEALRESLAIKWGTPAEIDAYLRNESRDFDFYAERTGWIMFREKALAILDATFTVSVHGAELLVVPDDAGIVRAYFTIAENQSEVFAAQFVAGDGGGVGLAPIGLATQLDTEIAEYVVAGLRERDNRKAGA